MKEDSTAPQEPAQETPAPARRNEASWFKTLAEGAKTLGGATVALVNRLRGVRDPDAAIAELDGQLSATRAQREPLSARYEELYAKIAAKKKMRQTAAPARRKMLEKELETLLAEYRSVERRLSTLFDHERIIVTVRERTLELAAQGLALPKVEDVDRLADDIENAVDETEDIADAVTDLDKAGVRRERTPVNLDEALAEFDETDAEPAAGGGETVQDALEE